MCRFSVGATLCGRPEIPTCTGLLSGQPHRVAPTYEQIVTNQIAVNDYLCGCPIDFLYQKYHRFFSDLAKKNVPIIRHITVRAAIAAKLTTGSNITTPSYSGVPAYTAARARSRQ